MAPCRIVVLCQLLSTILAFGYNECGESTGGNCAVRVFPLADSASLLQHTTRVSSGLSWNEDVDAPLAPVLPQVSPASASLPASMDIADVFPGAKDKQDLYCYLKQSFYDLARLPEGQLLQTLRTKRCALVSSSGALLSHAQGHEIDIGHDTIMRFHSPVMGFEKHVGSRTDINLVGSSTGISLNSWPVVGAHAVEALQTVVKRVFSQLYPHRMDMHEVPANGIHDPTTGSKGMLAALSNCRSVDAYEMTPSRNASAYPYHYYDNPFAAEFGTVAADDNPWHGMIKAEHDLWRRLSAGPVSDIEELGKTAYPGFATVRCPTPNTAPPAALGL